MRIALDTNILVYAEGVNGAQQASLAVELIKKLGDSTIFLPVQVLGELFRVLVGKFRVPPKQVSTIVFRWQNTFPLIESCQSVLLSALDLAVDHDLNIWDAVILAAAAEAHCLLLLSEDMQDGFTWRGVTVADPFANKKNELLKRVLES
jgi:predicted nucleic acid-binding protein